MGSATIQSTSGNPLVTESPNGDSEIQNLEDAQKLIKELRQKTRSQAQQLLAWRRAYKMQVNKGFFLKFLSVFVSVFCHRNAKI